MTEIRRILCPVNLSEGSVHALEQASAIATWSHAELTALHVYPPVFAPIPGLPAPRERLSPSEWQRVHDEVRALVASVPGGSGVCVIVDIGHAAPQILSQAAALPADLIVMGTHGASGYEHLVLGSVTEKVLRKAACPVLTVPPRAHLTSQVPFRRILCPVDFSMWSADAVQLASSVAAESGAVLDLLHVVEWPWHEPPPPAFDELPAEQAAALQEFRRYLVNRAFADLEALATPEIRARCRVATSVCHGKPYVEILRVAESDGADLIVQGIHGRNRVDLAVFGSTTNQIVRLATCPVLTVRR